MSEPIEIKIDNSEVTAKLLELARKTENLRPLIKKYRRYFLHLPRKITSKTKAAPINGRI